MVGLMLEILQSKNFVLSDSLSSFQIEQNLDMPSEQSLLDQTNEDRRINGQWALCLLLHEVLRLIYLSLITL